MSDFELESNVNFFEVFANGGDIADPGEGGEGGEGGGKPKPAAGGGAQQTDEEKAAAEAAKAKAAAEQKELEQLMNQGGSGNNGGEGGDGGEGGNGGDGGAGENVEVFKVLYEDFVEKGLLVEGEGDFDGSEESFVKAIETTVVAGIQEGIAQEIKTVFKDPERGEVALAMFKFLNAGGTVDEFQMLRSHDGIKTENFDAEDEATRTSEAKKALTKYYSTLQWSPETIKKHIDRSEAKGADALVDEARDVTIELQKVNTKKEQERIAALENEKQTKTIATKQFNSQALSLIEKEAEVAGFDLKDKAMKQKLKEYMFLPTEDYNGQKLPKFAVERLKAAETDPRFLITQALYLMNGMKPDEKTLETKAAKTLSDKLKVIQKSNGGAGSTSKTGLGQGSQQTKQNQLLDGDFDFDPDRMEVVVLPPAR